MKKITTEEFIRRSKEINGENKYDYSKVEYKGSNKKVCLICKICGTEFWQTPNNHISQKQGCPCCAGVKKSNTEEFISKAKQVHGDKYDYSETEYRGSNYEVKILCKKHNEYFWQVAESHLAGFCGCKKCMSELKSKLAKKSNTEEFISKAKQVHGDKYDYSRVNYISSKDPVCIVCPIHGEFWQRPHNHLQGQGCKLCKMEKIKSNTEEFISKAKQVHGDKYDYSETEYNGTHGKIKILCPAHGEFYMEAGAHLKGQGCKLCKREEFVQLEKNKFIRQAQSIFPEYDYSKVEYKNNRTKVCIICPAHGEFWITPSQLLRPQGCPSCSKTKSYAEKLINILLNEYNIKHEWNYSFPDCRDKNPLPFDFYIPSLNTCIEFDGRQHFIPIQCYGGKDGFEKTVKHDKQKNEYCKQHNIKLIRLSRFKHIKEDLIKEGVLND